MTNFSGMNHRLELISRVPLTSTSLKNIFHILRHEGSGSCHSFLTANEHAPLLHVHAIDANSVERSRYRALRQHSTLGF